jgi:hypothetical protein
MRAGRLTTLASAFAVGASPVGAETLFGLVDTGELFASVDDGASWNVRSTLPVRDAVGLVRGISGNELLLVSRAGGVYVSADGGTSWTSAGAVAASDVVAVDVRIRPNVSLLLLTAAGTLWESADAITFSPLVTLRAPDHVSITHDAAGNLYALTETGIVGASANGGSTWRAHGAIPISDGVEIEAVGSDLFVLTGAGDVWSSADAGSSWVAAGTLAQVHMAGMVLGESGVLYASTREGEVAVSSDGASWMWVGLINQLNVVALATDSPVTGTGVLPPTLGSILLSTPRPNPHRGTGGSVFYFTLPSPETIRFLLYDVRGRLAASRHPERFRAGPHSVYWDPGVGASGTFYVRMTTDSGRSAGTRWVLLR